MSRADDLNDAAAAGIITSDQAAKLASFLALRETPVAAAAVPASAAGSVPHVPAFDPLAADADAEAVHFVRGFQDVFLTIGLVLLLAGIGIAGPLAVGLTAGTYLGAVAAFILALTFVGERRLLLPGIALAVGFTLFAGVGTAVLIGANGWGVLFGRGVGDLARIQMIGGLASLAASGLFYGVFRVPFALALVAASATQAFFGLMSGTFGDDFASVRQYVFLVAGLAAFAAAMAYDLRDPLRRTLYADNAFWLHLIAAPLVVHSVLALVTEQGRFALTTEDAVLVIGVVLALALVAVVIDRRALLVAGLGYFAFAVARLVGGGGVMGYGAMLAITLVVVGGVVLGLAVGWRPFRQSLLGLLPRGGYLVRHLPPASPGIQ